MFKLHHPFICVIVSLSFFCVSSADDVLGCNGFVKSDIDINYSDVEVKLFTKQGSLKDQTECAPNNGYYFLPLYDKGEYILKVVPPEGWTFEPSEVLLSIDGTTDPCSVGKDINFEFKGFAVLGKVISSGSKNGPKEVSVELYGKGTSSIPVAHTFTSAGGSFMFTPIPPGDYTVKISHPIWKMNKTETGVKVIKHNGIIPEDSLSIVGYDVSGSVTSDNQPITGVSFVLFSPNRAKVTDCDESPLPEFSVNGLGLEGYSQLCHVTSNTQGVFTFPVLPLGDYVLVPHYKGSKSTKFDVHPKKLPFSVSHGSVILNTPFQVKGFTVSGKILWSLNGLPMNNAVVYLNGKEIGKTAADGTYVLENMRAGNYKLKVVADNVLFDETEVKITSTALQDVYPSSYKISGSLYSTISSGPYKVKILSSSSAPELIMTGSDGKFRVFLKPGKYSISPQVEDSQRNEGLLFSPGFREVELVNKPIDRVDFSQLKSTVKGRIVCMTACPPIAVNLKPKGKGPLKKVTSQNGRYEFTNIMPGDYDIYIEPGLGWCWDKETMPITVGKEVTNVPNFIQAGFTVTVVSSHETKINYWPEGNEKDKHEMTVSPGSTHICVPKSLPYIFEPIGCHGYKESRIRWTSGPVELFAITHANTFCIESSHPIEDLSVSIKSKSRNKDQNLESSVQVPVKISVIDKKSGVWKYEVTAYLGDGEVVTVSPAASISLFSPQTMTVKGALDCFNQTKPLFRAEKGQVISGKVMTADKHGLADVSISVLDEDGTALHIQHSSSDGTYKFPPIKAIPNYRLHAAKEGYVLTEEPTKGHFSAHKLAEIVVSVKDLVDGSPLQGVLLSLSGGKDYRRNAQTDLGGVMSFLSLSPGEYFLRPMMKEYKFHPSSKIISVEEGATVFFNLSGERVAYSGHGDVTSLNGEGEAGVVVEAVGLGSCALYQEEATSSSSGSFRIRGLQPSCEYNVRVKEGVDVNQHIAKSTPENITIQVKDADVEGLRLYALRPEWRTDVMVHVLPGKAEDLKTLRVRLSPEDAPDSTLHIIKLSEYKPSASGYSLQNVVVSFPPLPADGRMYIVRLESSLSQATHAYTNRPVHFKANSSFKLIRLPFKPRARVKEPELTQSSYVVLPLIILFTILIYNKEKALNLLALVMQTRILTRPSQSEDSGSDTFTETNFQKKSKSKLRKL